MQKRLLSKKHGWLLIMVFSLMLVGFGTICLASDQHQDIKFVIGQRNYWVGTVINQLDVAPFIENGRTYLPVAPLATAMNLSTLWDPETQQVTISKRTTINDKLNLRDQVVFTIGSQTRVFQHYECYNGLDWILVNQTETAMDAAPFIRENRTFLPARFVAEPFMYSIYWDGPTQTVTVKHGGQMGGY